ncbi:MAG TPA: peptidoglycan DD-metalloendopeptidase family protein [Candidatus Thiothrix moscowensis]|uniref:murein hydrolase activator EnvC family protein n=1 Tax=unclassified Thiothrix TaxID=2636184 RepID=UPI0025E1ACDB|nr:MULTISPECIES: peptidoglycan DD-metalloendopeptidase family protein [unclassified Thiothrix]HRJ52346.1 peptidoglycan DD-metalloendopeptidase family protein [Candidatus Thiothrix moscowensis]HRJ92661.1 peptidoglycan DD-metalloendopeptidase family protein [Candidatus Thiothrix moscowensis]
MKFYTNLYFCLLLLPWGMLHAADTTKQKQLQREIRQLSSSLDSQKDESDELQAEVARLEKKLGEASGRHYQTEKKIEETINKLHDTNQQKLKLETELESQKAGLAQQLQALYSTGGQSHLRLLLRQDDPSDISRTVRYFGYLNENRVARIQKVQKTLKSIDTLRASIDKDRVYLQDLNKSLEQQKQEMESTLSTRSVTLAKIKTDIRSTEKKLNKLKDEENSLQTIVDDIARKTETAASPDTETPAPTSQRNEPTKTANTPRAEETTDTTVKSSFTPDKPFSTLRGKLSWPIQGKIIHGYGSSRNEKQTWRGVVISAPGGSSVKAVAKGKVAFSGWLDGYGHLIILEHDNRYVSLYGYNRAVYKKVGAIVGANETIAAVGNSGGRSQDGLYFEIRQGSTPQNPARWCR